MSTEWFEPRHYRHFDLPVNQDFAAKRAMNSGYVARHAFSPLLHYEKVEKRYKKDPNSGKRILEPKSRPIKYASHRDACILSYYAHHLNKLLDAYYAQTDLSDCAIAYRALGMGNYDFSAAAYEFAKANAPCVILAFDVTGFFDNLDHKLLKERFKKLLNQPTLPDDWYKVFRSITDYHYVELEQLRSNPLFSARFRRGNRGLITTVKEMKDAGISFLANPEIRKGNKRGIPQGTPISAAASNVYMMDFDAAVKKYSDGIDALYRRYSDDILLICRSEHSDEAESIICELLKAERLEIAAHKTEKTSFDVLKTANSRAAQYLGFTLGEGGPAIRQSSLSRQWRKMKRAIRWAKKIGTNSMANGAADKIWTKKLRRRFSHLKVRSENGLRTIRNFSSYGRRSATAFGAGEKISNQIRRFERKAAAEIERLNRNKGASSNEDRKDSTGPE